MNCSNCGAGINDNSRFCPSCGAPVKVLQAAYAAPAVPPDYGAYAVPKKKKRIGCFVFLFLFLLVIGLGLAWLMGKFTLIKPKDLGVRFTEADYASAVQKAGLSVSFDGKTGKELEQYKKANKGKKLAIEDYEWTFSDVRRETLTLTPSEASALLSNIAPSFWWFSNVQVKAYPDGTMEGSSQLDLAGMLKTMLGEDIEIEGLDIPGFLKTKVNVYSKGKLTVRENEISAEPESFKVGPMDLMNNVLLEPEDIREAEDYLSHIYKIVPNLTIHSLTTDAKGQFVFDGTYPHSVSVKPKK